ncbi:MAG: hypothetical protein AAGI15_00855 [Pseudomonadota bacterium]
MLTQSHLHSGAALSTGLCRVVIAIPGIHWALTGQWLFAGVALVCLALTLLLPRLVQDPELKETARVLGALLIAAHVALGMYLELYERSRYYDKFAHFLGMGAIAVYLRTAVQRHCHKAGLRLPSGALALIAVSGAISLGALWELFEFALDQTGLFVTQRGLTDTMLDLLANALGALSARWRILADPVCDAHQPLRPARLAKPLPGAPWTYSTSAH